MKYNEKTTEQLETLRDCLNAQLDNYVGMPFPSLRSELVTYEIDSVDSDEVVITANHYFKGLIRDYTITIDGGIDDDVEYSKYVDNGDLIDGGYMPFERLPKILRITVAEIYEIYRKLETIENILDTRAEEEEEESEESEEEEVVETEEEEEEEESKEKSKEESKEKPEEDKENIMKRFDVYNAYIVNRDFRRIANALGFAGFDYDHFDDHFKTKLQNDAELSDLLEQLEDVESSQFLIYTCTKVRFYERYEYDIIAYLKVYGYDDNEDLQSIENIMCSRVVAYVTGVLSEYGY